MIAEATQQRPFEPYAPPQIFLGSFDLRQNALTDGCQHLRIWRRIRHFQADAYKRLASLQCRAPLPACLTTTHMHSDLIHLFLNQIVFNKQRKGFPGVLATHFRLLNISSTASFIRTRARLTWERTVPSEDSIIAATSAVENPSMSRNVTAIRSFSGRLFNAFINNRFSCSSTMSA